MRRSDDRRTRQSREAAEAKAHRPARDDRGGEEVRLARLLGQGAAGKRHYHSETFHGGAGQAEDREIPKEWADAGDEKKAKAMTAEQVAKFLDAAEGNRFENLFRLAFHVGCRPGELLALKWDD